MSKARNKGWDPIKRGPANPQSAMVKEFLESDGRKHFYTYRTDQPAVDCIAFGNRLYDGVALVFKDTSMHLSFKRRDRAAVRDWRHFQAIKNEVAGHDREAVEVFPAEMNLVDAANEYHLWVLPEGMMSELGFAGIAEINDQQDDMDHAAYRRGGKPGAVQRAFEDGIPTGLPLRAQVREAAEQLLESGWRPNDPLIETKDQGGG